MKTLSRTQPILSVLLTAFLLSIPGAARAEHSCDCSKDCEQACTDGKGENCKCDDCGCKDGKCSHGKCKHEAGHHDHGKGHGKAPAKKKAPEQKAE